MVIRIDTIPHGMQKYPTVGDWTLYPHLPNSYYIQIKVSETGNDDSNFAIAIHEMIEAYACMKAGITQEEVDEFDKGFIKLHPSKEPGDSERAPYFHQHVFATKIERKVIEFLACEAHEKTVDQVYEGK